MKKNASRKGKTAAFVPFMSYWPTYDSMNKAQQAWYFYWRSQIRQGNYIDTDLSYIFVLIYELLSGIGWQDPQEEYFSLIDALSDYSLVKSKFYKDGNQDLMHEAIPRVIALADAALRKNKQKGIVTIQPPQNQLANIDFDVIGTSDY